MAAAVPLINRVLKHKVGALMERWSMSSKAETREALYHEVKAVREVISDFETIRKSVASEGKR